MVPSKGLGVENMVSMAVKYSELSLRGFSSGFHNLFKDFIQVIGSDSSWANGKRNLRKIGDVANVISLS